MPHAPLLLLETPRLRKKHTHTMACVLRGEERPAQAAQHGGLAAKAPRFQIQRARRALRPPRGDLHRLPAGGVGVGRAGQAAQLGKRQRIHPRILPQIAVHYALHAPAAVEDWRPALCAAAGADGQPARLSQQQPGALRLGVRQVPKVARTAHAVAARPAASRRAAVQGAWDSRAPALAVAPRRTLRTRGCAIGVGSGQAVAVGAGGARRAHP
jgi:hypothetical protein